MKLAEGSLEECRYYPILAQDLGYGATAKLASDLDEVGRMLNAYAAAILTPPDSFSDSENALRPAPSRSASIDGTATEMPAAAIAPRSLAENHASPAARLLDLNRFIGKQMRRMIQPPM